MLSGARTRRRPVGRDAELPSLAILNGALTAACMDQSMKKSEVVGSVDRPEFSTPVAEAREVSGLTLAQPIRRSNPLPFRGRLVDT